MGSQRKLLSNFIVLEGLDGAGTTTQTELLTQRLGFEGASALSTCEPTRGPIGSFIRSVLRKEEVVDPCTLAYLFAADRNEHLYASGEGILAQLDRGTVVVCDRYFFSSLAYQSVGCSYERVASLNERFPLPEYLIFLDVPPAECQRRLATRPGIELFEASSMQEEIVHNYERGIAAAADDRMHLIRIDGTEPRERVAENIWRALSALPIQKV